MINRQTIIFFLPISMEAMIGGSTPVSFGGGENAASNTGDDSTFWDQRQLYMNPQSFQMRDSKLVQKSLTKGGHVVQYWGEDLTTIDVQGTTGSAGIEGINILRDIYRHEQIHYRKVLANRQREIAEAAALAQAEAEEEIYDGSFGGFLLGAADTLTGGAVSKTVSGITNTIDILFDKNPMGGRTAKSFKSVPTLAAFATNIDMYYQGEFFRGYFTSFGVTESANEPGHFSYSFNFVVTRRTGKRTNFMPWHRNPRSVDGEAAMAQVQSKGTFPGVENLSFPTEENFWPVYPESGIDNVDTIPDPDTTQSPDVGAEYGDSGPPNLQPLNRNALVKK